jgi:hypothetical protein
MSDQAIAEGKAAWARIQGNAKTTFSDWLLIGECLLVLRAQAMAEAKCNSPYGPRYQASISRLIASAGLQDVDSHERRSAIVLVENREAIERYRAGLTDAERRRANHCTTVVGLWRSQRRPCKSGPKPKMATTIPDPVYVPKPTTIDTEGLPAPCGRPIHHPARLSGALHEP